MSINQYTAGNKRLNFYCDTLSADKLITDELQVDNATIQNLNCPLITTTDPSKVTINDNGISAFRTEADELKADSINLVNLGDPSEIQDSIDCKKIDIPNFIFLEQTLWETGVAAKAYILPEPNYNLSTTTFDDSRFLYYTNPLIISDGSETLSVKISANYQAKSLASRESPEIRIRVKPIPDIFFADTNVIGCSGTCYAAQSPQISKLTLLPDITYDFTGSSYDMILIFKEVPLNILGLVFFIDAEIQIKKI